MFARRAVVHPPSVGIVVDGELASDMDGNGLAGWYVDGVEHLAVALFKPVSALFQAAAQRLAEHVLPAVACQRGGDGAIFHGGGGLVAV